MRLLSSIGPLSRRHARGASAAEMQRPYSLMFSMGIFRKIQKTKDQKK